MYIVVHIFGGLLESVTPYQSLALAEKGLAQTIPEPCHCDKDPDGGCSSYQEAHLVDAPIGLLGQEVRIETRHTPSKSS